MKRRVLISSANVAKFGRIFVNKLGMILISITIFWILTMNFQKVFPSAIKDLGYIAVRLSQSSKFSYDQKMKEKIGIEYYELMKLVSNKTSIDSKIMLPPQMWPWPQSGNPEFSQYFLYPAKLLRENRKAIFLPNNDTTHLLISWGEGLVENRLYGWPKFPVFAKRIYYLPQRRIVEVKNMGDITQWQNDSEEIIHRSSNNLFDITYTASNYDYWLRPVNIPLKPTTKFEEKIKSSWPQGTSLVARISFGDNLYAIFSSAANEKTDEWETLSLTDIFQRANDFAQLQGWPNNKLTVTGVGLNFGTSAVMPYMEKWGLIELEKGGQSRIEDVKRKIATDITYINLGNIFQLAGDADSAVTFYKKASLLSPTNPWSYYWMAELHKEKGELAISDKLYRRTIKLGPQISWFYYSLGNLLSGKGDYISAEKEFQKSLNLYPDSGWTHVGLGEIYQKQGDLSLAYQQFKLASEGARIDCTYDGIIASDKASIIEKLQKEIVNNSQVKINSNPNDSEAMFVMGKALVVLGDIEHAREFYDKAFKINPKLTEYDFDLPPKVTDQLAETMYGIKGKALEKGLVDSKPNALLDTYHSYIKYPKEYFPTDQGTIELDWTPPKNILESSGEQLNLIYQHLGIYLWANNHKISFSLYQKNKEWVTLDANNMFEPNKQYRLTINYGSKGMNLFINGVLIGHLDYFGGIDPSNDVYLGRGPLFEFTSKPIVLGYFENLRIYDYQKIRLN